MTGKELQAILHRHGWTHGAEYGIDFISKDRLLMCSIYREQAHVYFQSRRRYSLPWRSLCDFCYENKTPEQIVDVITHQHKARGSK